MSQDGLPKKALKPNDDARAPPLIPLRPRNEGDVKVFIGLNTDLCPFEAPHYL